VRNAELEVAFSGTLGQGLDRSQKRKLGEELRRVEGRVFGSWRVEIVVGCTVRGYPFYQLLPLVCAPARTRESRSQAQPHTEPGCLAPARTREPDTSPGAAWERHNTRERPDQTQPHNGPASLAPARTREPGGDDESPRPGAACEEQSTLPF